MNLTSELTYYLTLFEQMTIYTFVYHHICRPKRSYWLTVGFYFACVSAVHIVLLPFGDDAMQKLFPHLMLMLVQFPVMLLYEESWKKRILLPIFNIVIQSVTEVITVWMFAATTGTSMSSFDYSNGDYNSTTLAGARMFYIDVIMLVAVLLILLLLRDRTLLRDMTLIPAFVGGHLIFLDIYLRVIDHSLTDVAVLLQLAYQVMFGTLLILQYYGALKRRGLLEEAAEVKALRQQIESNEQYYRLAESKFAEVSKLRHDLQTQLRTVSVMMQDSEGEKAADRIMKTLCERLEMTKTPVLCENPTLNAVLNVKLGDTRYKQLVPEIVLNDCGHLPYDDYDLCSLVSNLFDNAAESCLREPCPEQTELTLKAGLRSGCFVIRCVNTCSVVPSVGTTTKKGTEHGYGSAIIRSICEKYDGDYSIKYRNGQAVATVILQLDGSSKVC